MLLLFKLGVLWLYLRLAIGSVAFGGPLDYNCADEF